MAFKNIKLKSKLTEAAHLRNFIVHETPYMGDDMTGMRMYSAKSIVDLLIQLGQLDPKEHTHLSDKDALEEFEMGNGDGQPYYTIAELRGNRLFAINY